MHYGSTKGCVLTSHWEPLECFWVHLVLRGGHLNLIQQRLELKGSRLVFGVEQSLLVDEVH